jgi:phosphoglycolate phosphatase
MRLPPRPAALLLDFDGVIVDSVALKTQAFLDIYHDATAVQIGRILAHQRAHGGVTRRLKFDWFEREVFGRRPTAEDLDRLAADYAARVYEGVLGCGLIPGARDFLEAVHARCDLHVVSGTPQGELADIVARRGLARYFRSVTGAPMTKLEAFASIVAANGYDTSRVVAIGDATTEFDAANALGIAFLGIAPAHANPFPAPVAVIPTMEPAATTLGFA